VGGRKKKQSEPRQGKRWTRHTPSCDEGGASTCRKGRGAKSKPPKGLAETTTAAQSSLIAKVKCHRRRRGGLVILTCQITVSTVARGSGNWRENLEGGVGAFMDLGESAANRQVSKWAPCTWKCCLRQIWDNLAQSGPRHGRQRGQVTNLKTWLGEEEESGAEKLSVG